MVLWASKHVAGGPVLLCVQFGKYDTEPECTREDEEGGYCDLPMTMWVTDLKDCWSTSFLPDALVEPTEPILSGPLPYSWYHFQKVFQRSFKSQNVTMSLTPDDDSSTPTCSVKVKLNFDSTQPTFWKPRFETAPEGIVKKLGMLMYKCYRLLSRKLSLALGSDEEDDSDSSEVASLEDNVPAVEVEHDTPPSPDVLPNPLKCDTPRRYRRRKSAQQQSQAWHRKRLEPDLPSQRMVQTRRKAPRFAAVGKLLIPSPRKGGVSLPTFDEKKPYSPPLPDSHTPFRRRQASQTDDSSMECMRPSHLTPEEFTKEVQLRVMHHTKRSNTSPSGVPITWSVSDDSDPAKARNSPPPTPPRRPRSPQVPHSSRPKQPRGAITNKKDTGPLAGFTGRSPMVTPSLSPVSHSITPLGLENADIEVSTLVHELFPDYSQMAKSELAKVTTWEFDAFALATVTDRPLYSVGYLLMHATGLVRKFAINDLKLQNFLTKVEGLYMHNPYHNAIHACDVTQASWLLLQSLVGHPHYDVRPLDFLCMLVAAVGHDVGHPGWNNHLEKAMKTERALVYNDLSVLENYHASALFRILNEPGCDVLGGMPSEEVSYVRSLAVHMILATDVGKNMMFVDDVKEMLRKGGEGPKEEMRRAVFSLCLKCADVSNPVRERKVAVQWAERVITEFHDQGDRERLLGLPITKFMDRYSHHDSSTAECQVGFISAIVVPLYQLMAAATQPLSTSAIDPALSTLLHNLECWKRQEQAEKGK